MNASQADASFSSAPIHGVCSALLVPRTPEHQVDYAATERLLRFQLEKGVRSFALNGATGEYTRSSADEIQILSQFVKSKLSSGVVLVLGVGAADSHGIQRLMDIGLEAGVNGYLLPVPHYFPIAQQDFVALVQALRLERPTYLYNLPSFTTVIEPETALQLCRSKCGVVGVKDSCGSLETVTLLSEKAKGAACIIGNDSALHQALKNGVCDGVVSGVAGVLPELMQTLYAETSKNAGSDVSLLLKKTLDEYIFWLQRFPVPWGLKITAEFRGLFEAEFSLPLSEERRATAAQFKTWLSENSSRLMIS